MKEKYNKLLQHIKKLFIRKHLVGYSESNVTSDWLKVLFGAFLFGFALICMGVYLYFSWQKTTHDEGSQNSIQQETYSSDFLKHIVNQYQTRAVEFVNLQKQSPPTPSVGVPQTSKAEELGFEETETEEAPLFEGSQTESLN